MVPIPQIVTTMPTIRPEMLSLFDNAITSSLFYRVRRPGASAAFRAARGELDPQ